MDPETQELHIDGYTKSHLNAAISHIAGEYQFEESQRC